MEFLKVSEIETHSLNPNLMNDKNLAKLEELIRMEDNYPPLIVNKRDGKYILIDGHQRLRILRKLKKTEAKVDIWEVPEEQELLLLATLNKLHGKSIAEKKRELYSRLREMLPEKKIDRLTTDGRQFFEEIAKRKEQAREKISKGNSIKALKIQMVQLLTREQFEFVSEYIDSHFSENRNEAIYHMAYKLKEMGI